MDGTWKTFRQVRQGNLQKHRYQKNEHKKGTSKVGAISKAQKAQNILLEKKLEFFEKIFSFKKSRIVLKIVKGDPFDLLTCILLQNNKKLEGGTLWGH